MIRLATEADFPRLIELGRAMHAESPMYRDLPFDDEVLRGTLDYVLKNGFLCVHERNGHVDGVMVAVISPSWFGPGKTASDLALFVEPTARGGVIACQLIERFNAWADAGGVHAQYLGTTTMVDPEKVRRLFEHKEFVRVGDIFIRKGSHVHRS